ncbi:sugar phosphate isomerase/epimerase family protein [Telmatocola sphagniphila]|nr:sugar phosphate isomerase/epimerase [Telmatocola sphagniphila]
MSTPFAEDVNACADSGWKAVEIWLTKLEKHLETASLDSVRELFANRGIQAVAAAYQGGLLLSHGESRQAHFEHFRRRLELCEALKIPTLLLAADYLPKMDPAAWERALVSLKQAGQWAAGFGVHLALEFRGTDAFCTNLSTTAQFVEAIQEPNVGLCLDIFHYYKGPSKFQDLEAIDPRLIRHVQLCDVAGVLRELMTDSDRILPGDGEFEIQPIVQKLADTGYTGYLSLELMNPTLWSMKPTQVAELGLTALDRIRSSISHPSTKDS